MIDGQYRYRDVTFGLGTDLVVTAVDGLNSVEVRTGDAALPRGHGAVPGPHFVAAKQPVFEFAITGGTERLDALTQLITDTFTVQSEPLPLEWKRPGVGSRLMYVRPLQVAAPRAGAGLRRPKVAFTATDPRIYAAETRQVSVPLFTPSGGALDLPADFPLDFPAGATLDVVALNAGGADAFPLVRWYGPTDGGTVTSVTLRNLTTGEAQTITTPLGADQILTADNLAHVTGSGRQVIGLDGASRYGAWEQPRVPFRLPPGESVLRFETTGTSTAVQCLVTWADTWLG
jgi:hypothetical protein